MDGPKGPPISDADENSELERLLSDPSAKAMVRAFMRITPSLIAVVRSPDLRVLFVSAFGARLVGVSAEDLQGAPFEAYEKAVRVFMSDGREASRRERLLYRAAQGETIIGEEGLVLDRDGEMVPVLCNAAPIHKPDGEVMGGVMVCTDVRALKRLEAELRVAYRELVHRVKNHLQIMSSLIALDARDPDITAAELAENNQARLKMLAAVYDGMVQAEAGESIGARAFIELVGRPYRTEKIVVETTVAPDDLTLSPDQAVPFGMLLNEAICNSYKHAFPDGAGVVSVTLRQAPSDRLTLEVADNGVGLPAELPKPSSHGLTLMRMQAETLHASFEIARGPAGGTVVRCVIPDALAR